MHTHKIINIPSPDSHLQSILGKELGIFKITAQVLINRGATNASEADKFLNADLKNLLDPFSFTHMHNAVSLIKKAAQRKEKVMIFGDYDVDGITGISLLRNTFIKTGLRLSHYLPHRVKEGYGLNRNTPELVKNSGAKLLITVDCGINSSQEIKELRRNNIDVIITDHHEPQGYDLPEANAVINPKAKGSGYGYKELAGVGVAYKLCQAVAGQKLFDELDLVSLGTIADVVPLTGENRIIAKEGLVRLSRTKKSGLKALIEVSRIKNKQINSSIVSFILGPRLNASGRIDTAETALNLLLCSEGQDKEAYNLAKVIDSHNRQRQKIENKILEEAYDLIQQQINFKEHKVIVIAKEDWHPGVLGIVASKLADKFYRPTIVISKNHFLCKGSGRSIKNFHLFQALLECRQHLKNFGGHSHAVGLSIEKDSIDEFRVSINSLAGKKMRLEDLLPSIDIDMEVGFPDLNLRLAEELQRLQPFGTDNPEPVFYARGLKLAGYPQVLGRNTLKFRAEGSRVVFPVIGFGMSDLAGELLNSSSLDLVFTLKIDSWLQEESIILEAKHIFFRQTLS